MKEIFEQYKGRKAILNGETGIICGFDKCNLIMACDSDCGWIPYYFDEIKTHKEHKNGYLYVSIDNILPE